MTGDVKWPDGATSMDACVCLVSTDRQTNPVHVPVPEAQVGARALTEVVSDCPLWTAGDCLMQTGMT